MLIRRCVENAASRFASRPGQAGQQAGLPSTVCQTAGIQSCGSAKPKLMRGSQVLAFPGELFRTWPRNLLEPCSITGWMQRATLAIGESCWQLTAIAGQKLLACTRVQADAMRVELYLKCARPEHR